MKIEHKNIPFYNTKTAPSYEYTAEMYEEDKKLVNFFINKFAHYLEYDKSVDRDDIEQYCLMRCWQFRPRWDKSKGHYSTYISFICKSVIFNKCLRRRFIQDNDRLDLDFVIADDFTTLDTVADDSHKINDTAEQIEARRIIYQAVDNIKAPVARCRAKEIVDLFISGRVIYGTEAGEILGLSRERVRQLLNKVRKNAWQIYQHGNMFSRQKAEQQLVLLKQTKRPRKAGRPKRIKSPKLPKEPKPKTPRTPKPRLPKQRVVVEIDIKQATLKDLYQAKGMTQKELAQMVGVDSSSIGYWSRGCWRPTPERIDQLAKIFACTYDEMCQVITRTATSNPRAKRKVKHFESYEMVDVDSPQATLKTLCKAKRITQTEIAKQLGVHQSYVNNWATGKYRPTAKHIAKLAEIFDCTYDKMHEIILRKEYRK